jgi:hypothetical protein
MKRTVLAGVVLVLAAAASGLASLNTGITYNLSDLGGGRWQYTYDVTNDGLAAPIEEFTVWFDYDLYSNLAVETPTTPSGWDQLVLQPEPVLLDDGAFDARALGGGIGIGQSLGDFSVSFDFSGIGEPGPQPYDIVDPQTFQPIESGTTVPEPTTLLLLGLGGIVLRRKRAV